MKRFALSPISPPSSTDPELGYRSSLYDVLSNPRNILSYIPSNPDGTPKLSYSYDVFSCLDLRPLNNASGIYVLPDVSFDVKVAAVGEDKVQNLRNELDARGITHEWITLDTLWRTVLYGIGQRMEPGFQLDGFDVREVS